MSEKKRPDDLTVCPLAKKCGGCDYQGMAYEQQLKEKLDLFDASSVDVQNSAEFQNYKFIADKFLSDKNTVAECRSGINEECKKYYKAVDMIKPAG